MKKPGMNRVHLQGVIGLFLLLYCADTQKLEKEYQAAMNLYASNKLEESIKALENIYKKDAEFKSTALYLGKLYYFKSRFKESYEILSKIESEDSEKLHVLLWKIKCAYAAKMPDKDILKMTDEYVKQETMNPEILFIRGRIYENMGKLDEAIRQYSALAALSSKVSLGHVRLAEIYKNAGSEVKSKKHKKNAEKLFQ